MLPQARRAITGRNRPGCKPTAQLVYFEE